MGSKKSTCLSLGPDFPLNKDDDSSHIETETRVSLDLKFERSKSMLLSLPFSFNVLAFQL